MEFDEPAREVFLTGMKSQPPIARYGGIDDERRSETEKFCTQGVEESVGAM